MLQPKPPRTQSSRLPRFRAYAGEQAGTLSDDELIEQYRRKHYGQQAPPADVLAREIEARADMRLSAQSAGGTFLPSFRQLTGPAAESYTDDRLVVDYLRKHMPDADPFDPAVYHAAAREIETRAGQRLSGHMPQMKPSMAGPMPQRSVLMDPSASASGFEMNVPALGAAGPFVPGGMPSGDGGHQPIRALELLRYQSPEAYNLLVRGAADKASAGIGLGPIEQQAVEREVAREAEKAPRQSFFPDPQSLSGFFDRSSADPDQVEVAASTYRPAMAGQPDRGQVAFAPEGGVTRARPDQVEAAQERTDMLLQARSAVAMLTPQQKGQLAAQAVERLQSGQPLTLEHQEALEQTTPGLGAELWNALQRGYYGTASSLGEFYHRMGFFPETYGAIAEEARGKALEHAPSARVQAAGSDFNQALRDPAAALRWLASGVTESLPAMAPSVAAGVASGGASIPAQMAGQFVLNAPQSIGAQFEDAGIDAFGNRKPLSAGQYGAVISSGIYSAGVESLADVLLAGRLQKALGTSRLPEIDQAEMAREMSSRVGRVLREAHEQGKVESVTEAVQQVIQNTAARHGWDPDREVTDGLAQSFVVGYAAGAVLAGAPTAVSEGVAAARGVGAQTDQGQAETTAGGVGAQTGRTGPDDRPPVSTVEAGAALPVPDVSAWEREVMRDEQAAAREQALQQRQAEREARRQAFIEADRQRAEEARLEAASTTDPEAITEDVAQLIGGQMEALREQIYDPATPKAERLELIRDYQTLERLLRSAPVMRDGPQAMASSASRPSLLPAGGAPEVRSDPSGAGSALTQAAGLDERAQPGGMELPESGAAAGISTSDRSAQQAVAPAASGGSDQQLQLTDSWQEVPAGSVVPMGAEVRMDQSTGKSYARLMPGETAQPVQAAAAQQQSGASRTTSDSTVGTEGRPSVPVRPAAPSDPTDASTSIDTPVPSLPRSADVDGQPSQLISADGSPGSVAVASAKPATPPPGSEPPLPATTTDPDGFNAPGQVAAIPVGEEVEPVQAQTAFYDLPATTQPYVEGSSGTGAGTAGDGQAGRPPVVAPIERGGVAETLGGTDQMQPLEMPELVRLVKQLTSEIPRISTRLQKANGTFYAVGDGRITLRADLFQNPEEAARVFTHEIGHLVDFAPDQETARGGILGRIASLRGYVGQVLEPEAGPGGRKLAGPTLKASALRDELWAFSQAWRPFDPSAATPEYLAYRRSSAELYADAVSGLLVAPEYLKQQAPQFYEAFFGYLDQKPDVEAAYFELQRDLSGDRHTILEKRSESVRGMARRGEALNEQLIQDRKDGEASLLQKLRLLAEDRFMPVLQKVTEAEKNGAIIKPSEDPRILLEEMAMGETAVYQLLKSVERNVTGPLTQAGLTIEDLHEFMYYTRVSRERIETEQSAARREELEAMAAQGDEAARDLLEAFQPETEGRATLANPLGFTPRQAEEGLAHLRDKLGAERFGELEARTRAFQDLIFEEYRKAADAGVISRAFFERAIEPNRYAYATFRVLDFVDRADSVTASLKRQKGTFRDVDNVFVATLFKTAALQRAVVRNRAATSWRELFQAHFEGEIRPLAQHERPKPAEGEVRLLEDGRWVRYATDPYTAGALDAASPQMLRMATAVARFITTPDRKIARPLYITYNVSFSLFMNPIRDAKRFYKNTDLSIIEMVKYFGRGFARARRHVKGEEDPVVRQMLDDFAITPPGELLAQGLGGEDTFSRMLKRAGVTDTRRSESKKGIRLALRLLASPARWTANAGATLEALSKIAGYTAMLDRAHAKGLTGSEARKVAAYQTRNYIGTPNFTRRGQVTDVSNSLFMFSNIAIQGYRSDLSIMTGQAAYAPTTPGAYLLRTAMINLVPKVVMQAAAVGLMGAALEEWMKHVPEYDKTSYTIIPLPPFYYEGKAVYLRIPHDETGRLFGGLLWKATQAMAGERPKELAQLLDLGGDVVPDLSPTLTLGGQWGTFLAGRNPVDSFRGREVLPQRIFEAGGKDAWQRMVEHSANSFGITRLETYAPEDRTLAEYLFGVTPGLNRIVKMSNYGVVEEQRADLGIDRMNRARQRLRYSREVQKSASRYYMLQQIPKGDRTADQASEYEFMKAWHGGIYRPLDEAILQLDERARTEAIPQEERDAAAEHRDLLKARLDSLTAETMPRFKEALRALRNERDDGDSGGD